MHETWITDLACFHAKGAEEDHGMLLFSTSEESGRKNRPRGEKRKKAKILNKTKSYWEKTATAALIWTRFSLS